MMIASAVALRVYGFLAGRKRLVEVAEGSLLILL